VKGFLHTYYFAIYVWLMRMDASRPAAQHLALPILWAGRIVPTSRFIRAEQSEHHSETLPNMSLSPSHVFPFGNSPPCAIRCGLEPTDAHHWPGSGTLSASPNPGAC
jgi:hypothetical protein